LLPGWRFAYPGLRVVQPFQGWGMGCSFAGAGAINVPPYGDLQAMVTK